MWRCYWALVCTGSSYTRLLPGKTRRVVPLVLQQLLFQVPASLVRLEAGSFTKSQAEPMGTPTASWITAIHEGKRIISICSSFQVQYSSQMSGSKLTKLLAAIPEIKLMLEPA